MSKVVQKCPNMSNFACKSLAKKSKTCKILAKTCNRLQKSKVTLSKKQVVWQKSHSTTTQGRVLESFH